MDLVVLVIAGVVIYYVVTGLTRWWDGYRNRHNVPLQVVALTVVVLVAVWVSQSATGARVADLAIGAVLVLAVLAVAVLAVAGWRRGSTQKAAVSRAAEMQHQQARRSGSRPWKSDDEVYALGAYDALTDELRAIKIGWTGRDGGEGVREAEVEEQQLGRMNTSKRLGRGPGGEWREERMHARLDQWRYPRSEWFAPSPQVLAAVSELEQLTEDGRALVRTAGYPSRMTRGQSPTVAS